MQYEVKIVHTVEYAVMVDGQTAGSPQEAVELATQDLIHSGELSLKERRTGVESHRVSGIRMVQR